jgi:hypothetical protein
VRASASVPNSRALGLPLGPSAGFGSAIRAGAKPATIRLPLTCRPSSIAGAVTSLKDLKFRCTKCGSRLTDHVTMAKDALSVQPWRAE